MLVYDDLEPRTEKIKIYDKQLKLNGPSDADTHEALTNNRIGDLYVPRIESTEALKRVADQFLDSVAGRCQPESDGASGWRVVKILEAASGEPEPAWLHLSSL